MLMPPRHSLLSPSQRASLLGPHPTPGAIQPASSPLLQLWSCGSGTYAAHRACLEARRRAAQEAAEAASRGALRAAAPLHTLPATVKYSFEGKHHGFGRDVRRSWEAGG